VHVQKRESYRG